MFELITNAEVYAPQSLGIQNLLVCAGKIVYIGTQVPQLDDKLSVETTDLDGARIIPGFIDAHAHITGGGGEAGPSTRVPPLDLSQFTQAGVTSVVGLLGTDDLTRNTQTLLTQVMGFAGDMPPGFDGLVIVVRRNWESQHLTQILTDL